MHEVWRVPPAVARRVAQRPDVTRILLELLVGEYPLAEDIRWLADIYGVATIVNLQDARDLQVFAIDLGEMRRAAAECGVAYHHFPVPDCQPEGFTTALSPILAALARATASGQVTYLHCNAGLNRAPTVAIAYLYAHYGLPLPEACALVKSRRACGPYMRVLEEYFAA